jgi:hypothetical protein
MAIIYASTSRLIHQAADVLPNTVSIMRPADALTFTGVQYRTLTYAFQAPIVETLHPITLSAASPRRPDRRHL